MASTIEEQTDPEFTELEWKLAFSRGPAHSPQQPTPVPTSDDRATPESIPPERLH